MFRRPRDLALPALLGIFVFAAYILTAPNDLWGNGDTYLRYQVTQAIVDHGKIHYVSSFRNPSPRWHDKRVRLCRDRRLCTIYAPGQIFAMIPLYLLGKFVAHHFTHDYYLTPFYSTHMLDDIFGALLAVVFFLLALALGYSRRVATFLTMIFAFASVAWPDAESMLEHTQVSFFLALSVLCALLYVNGAMRRHWWVLLSGLSLGCAFLTRYDTGILFPLIPLYLAASRISIRKPFIHAVNPTIPESLRHSAMRVIRGSFSDKRLLGLVALDWVLYLVALVPAFAAAAAWNYARFGKVTKTGIPPTFGEPFIQGFTGLVMSPGKGIIWYMPIVFVLPFVIREFWRQHRVATLLFGAIIVTELGLFSQVIYWHGDPAWGPRYIFATAPYLVLPVGVLLERWQGISQKARRAFVGVVLLSLSIQFTGVVTPQYRFWYEEIHSQLVARQGFNWGSRYGHFWYDYYWNLSRNPILLTFKNLYEITALRILGLHQYYLYKSPIPDGFILNLSNPVHQYEINNFNVWWLGTYQAFIGTHKDVALAAAWFLLAAASLYLLWKEVAATPALGEPVVVPLNRKPA